MTGATRIAHRLLQAEAALLLVGVHACLRVLPYRRVRDVMDRWARVRLADEQSVARVRTIAAAVCAVGRRLPATTCLMEALVAHAMLRRRGHDTELRLGVRRSRTDSTQVEGHAWLEHRGVVILGEIGDLDEYRVMSRMPSAV